MKHVSRRILCGCLLLLFTTFVLISCTPAGTDAESSAASGITETEPAKETLSQTEKPTDTPASARPMTRWSSTAA